MITPELKDLILNDLIKFGPKCAQDIHKAEEEFNISSDLLEIILDQFEKMGLLEQEKMLGGSVFISLTADAYDIQRRGGFVAQEELLLNNIEKLLLELENLQKSFPQKAATIATIASGISGALALFKP